MEREVSLLRCSKLSCYSEFNRMVQAIARNGGEGDIPGTRPQTGTSAEYNFYATLVLMLKQVISNTDGATQKLELQRVYEWFRLNKPLLKSKTKPKQRKPKVSITNSDKIDPLSPLLHSDDLCRPQTAPASFYKAKRSHSDVTGIGMRKTDRDKHSAPRRRATFTAMYVSRSLCGGLDLIGQTFDQLQLQQKQNNTGISKSQEGIGPTATTGGQSTPAIEDRGSTLSIVDLPSADFLANTSPKHRLTTVRPVSIAAVFSMAPSIAAQMALERELNEEYQSNRRRILSGHHTTIHTQQRNHHHHSVQSSSRQLVTTPVENGAAETSKPLRYTEDVSEHVDSTSGSTATGSSRVQQVNQDHGHHAESSSSSQTPPHQGSHGGELKERNDNCTISPPITKDKSERYSNREEKLDESTKLPSEIQEVMVDMKAVNNILPQVAVRQKSSPRSHEKESYRNHGMNLQIEGQGVRRSMDKSGQQRKVVKENTVTPLQTSSVRSSDENRSESQVSLSIKSVNLQQHSRKISTAQHLQGRQNVETDTRHVSSDLEPAQDKSAVPEAQESVHNSTSSKEDHTQSVEKHKQLPEHDSLTNENSSSNTHQDDLEQEERETLQTEEASHLATESDTSANEMKDAGSQVVLGDCPKSPVVLVKASSPNPINCMSSRPSSSHQKSRLPSPMNVVSLSFPTNKHQRSRSEGLKNGEVKRKTPVIIAGFNKRRYKRLKSPQVAEQYKVL